MIASTSERVGIAMGTSGHQGEWLPEYAPYFTGTRSMRAIH
jgi:hypothetical protein